VANYPGPWTKILQDAGGYSPEEARAAALQMTDDAYSLPFAWLTNDKLPRAALSRTTTCWPASRTSARTSARPTPSCSRPSRSRV
jgi:hypothetical protein